MTRTFLLIAALLALPVSAQAGTVIKDSVYFTLDDGIQTPEEMEEESLFLHGLCMNNGYQSLYFNCDCLAGAFLSEREKLGPTVPQQDIMYRLTKTRNAVCANTEEIAQSTYQDCMSYAKFSRELETDNEDYCTCAANKMATDFSKNPRLNTRHVRNLRSNALLFCRKPQNRPVRPTAAN